MRDGQQCRDFVYVGNVVQANLLAATIPEAAGRCYNIGCGQRTTLNQLVEILGRLASKPFRPQYGPARMGDIRDSVADIGRATKELGYHPEIDVQEGLRRLLNAQGNTQGAGAV